MFKKIIVIAGLLCSSGAFAYSIDDSVRINFLNKTDNPMRIASRSITYGCGQIVGRDSLLPFGFLGIYLSCEDESAQRGYDPHDYEYGEAEADIISTSEQEKIIGRLKITQGGCALLTSDAHYLVEIPQQSKGRCEVTINKL